MKKILLPLLVLAAGVGVGGAAGYGAIRIAGPTPAPSAAHDEAEELAFVPAEGILAPLILSDGRLSGYVSFDVELGVPADKAEHVAARLPLLLHAINLRTYRTPMAAGPDGMLPDIDGFRRLVLDASPEAFGPQVVRKVAVTQAVPA